MSGCRWEMVQNGEQFVAEIPSFFFQAFSDTCFLLRVGSGLVKNKLFEP